MTALQKNTLSTVFKVLLPIAVLILVVIGALSLIKSEFGHSRPQGAAVSITDGNILPDFNLTQLDGKNTLLSTVATTRQAKVILINFWASWCEACMEEMPSLVKLRNAHVQEGFEIIGVNLDENPEAVVPGVMKQFGIEFPIFKDTDGSIADLFDVHAIPMTVVLNQNRKILYHKDGDQNWNSPTIHSELKRWLRE